jgi:hypothetical protein
MINECDGVGGRGNGSTGRRPALGPLFPSQIIHDLTWDGTLAAAVGNRLSLLWLISSQLINFEPTVFDT